MSFLRRRFYADDGEISGRSRVKGMYSVQAVVGHIFDLHKMEVEEYSILRYKLRKAICQG